MFARIAAVALALLLAPHVNAAPLIYGTYYEEVSTSFNCNAFGTSCMSLFSQTPADKLLMVSRITCSVSSSYQPSVFTLEVSATNGGAAVPGRTYYLAPIPRSFSNGQWITQVNDEVHFLVGQGRFPNVRIDIVTGAGAGTNTITCTIVGDLVTPIQ